MEDNDDFLSPQVVQTEEPNLKEYWAVVRNHQRLIATLFVSALLLTSLVVLSMTPLYRAESTILIERQTPQVLDIRDLMSEQPGTDEHNYYETQYKILTSRSLAADVISELGLQNNPLFNSEKKSGVFTRLWSKL